jgi:hypothetical protein
MHGLNASYGHKSILSSFTGEVHELPIWGFVQHGWTPFDGWTERKNLPARWPRFVWSSSVIERRPSHRKPAPYRTIGSPFAYLVTHLGGHLIPAPGNGCIAFPVHSSESASVIGSHKQYARELVEREGTVDVCLYWRDLEDAETRNAYEECGHRLVTVGTPRTDRFFLARWLRLLEGKTRAVSNRVSTSVIYAASLGLRAEVYGTPMRVVGLGESTDEDRDHGLTLLPPAVSGVAYIPPDWARQELGFGELLSPEDLCDALGWRGWRREVGPLAVAGINLARIVRRGPVYRE